MRLLRYTDLKKIVVKFKKFKKLYGRWIVARSPGSPSYYLSLGNSSPVLCSFAIILSYLILFLIIHHSESFIPVVLPICRHSIRVNIGIGKSYLETCPGPLLESRNKEIKTMVSIFHQTNKQVRLTLHFILFFTSKSPKITTCMFEFFFVTLPFTFVTSNRSLISPSSPIAIVCALT